MDLRQAPDNYGLISVLDFLISVLENLFKFLPSCFKIILKKSCQFWLEKSTKFYCGGSFVSFDSKFSHLAWKNIAINQGEI